MPKNRVWVWTGRLVALVAAVVIPACGSTGSPGGSNPNGILWNTQGNSNPPQSNQPFVGWNDPNTGVAQPIGIGNIVTSADDAVYSSYFMTGGQTTNGGQIAYVPTNDPAALLPLSTDTGSPSITNRENSLQGLLNGYRQQTLGNVGAGGNGGGLGGGVAVGNTQGIILSGHFKATKSARAHAKYFDILDLPTFAAGANQQGDDLQTSNNVPPVTATGLPAPGNPDGVFGRLGKIQVTAATPGGGFGTWTPNICFAGTGYGEANQAYAYLVQNAYQAIVAMGPTNFAVGHWRSGPQQYYWDIVYLRSPLPPN